MDDNVLNQIASAVNAILDPKTSNNERKTAHRICESCKENEMSALIGFAFASRQDIEPHLKQFGLQLMQNFVRARWVKAAQEIQIQTKNNAMQLLENCSANESSYVKDGIAHVLVEIVKHVWPQQWPTMVQELLAIANRSTVQTELVELVFLRIAEDVAVLQNVSVSHRSSDIRQGLTLSMGDLMEFFMRVLEVNSMKYTALLGSENETEVRERNVHHLLCITTLKTLQGYLEWANTEHIFAENGTRVQLLCKLLEVQGLRTLAADCLVLAVHRKGQPSDRKRILVLTTPAYVYQMARAIAMSKPAEEDQYLFLRRLGDLLSSLVNHLVTGWSPKDCSAEKEGIITDLSSHTNFLDILLEFLKQDNPVIADTVTGAWNVMLQHREIIKDKTLRLYIPTLLQTVVNKVHRCFNAELPVCAQLDFNDMEEVQLFLTLHKKNLLQVVRGCCCACPNEGITFTLKWLREVLSSRVDTGEDENGIKREYCTSKSPSFGQWDTLKSIADITIKTGIQHAKRQGVISTTPVAETELLLKDIFSYESSDVILRRCLIGIIGAFLPMLDLFEHKKQIVQCIIHSYATTLRFSATHPNQHLTLISQLRRHALSAFVHLCKYFPSLVILAHDDFEQTIRELIPFVGDLDKISLFESMVLISGEWNNYEQQSAFIGNAMSYAAKLWVPLDDLRIQNPKSFAKAIGLCSPGEEYIQEEAMRFRGNISFCVALTLAMINRSRVPENVETQRSGGFLDTDGNVMHPCAKHVFVIMENIAALVQNFHALWTAPLMAVMHKDYVKSLNIRDAERKNMVSFNPAVGKDVGELVEKSSWEKMQTFILIVLENCYQILGGVGKCVQLYQNQEILSVLVGKSFHDLQTLPELRIRSFTRQFLYNFLKSCPESHFQKVVAPILHKYCGFMNRALQVQWNEYAAKEQARLKLVESGPSQSESYEDMKEEDEILKDQLLRTVSREYLEMLVNLCVNKNPPSKNGSDENSATASKDDAMCEEEMPSQSTQHIRQLTPLGTFLMQTDLAEVLLGTCLTSLSWDDTTTAFKGVQLTWPLLKHMFTGSLFIPDDAAKFIFESILNGLRQHGQHDGCLGQLMGMALYTFVSLRPTHDSLLEIMRAIPKVNPSALEAFDKGYTGYSEKKQKASFKKLVSGVIKEHIGQRFKCRKEMRRLPKFFQGRKAKTLDFDVESLGLEMFFKPE